MSYVYRSSDAAEAGFVEAFFREKGFTPLLRANAAIYGMQAYDVVVQEDVGLEIEAELKARLNALTPAEQGAGASPVQDAEAPPFSLFQIFAVVAVATLIVRGVYSILGKFSYHYLGDVITSFGLALVAYVIMAIFIFTCVRLKLRAGAVAFFGLERVSFPAIFIWSLVGALWTLFALFLKSRLSIPDHPREASNWPVQVIVIPLCYDIFYVGFLAKALDLIVGRIPAVILSATVLFLIGWLEHSHSGSAFAMVSLLLCTSARLQSGSAYPPAAMMAVAWLTHLYAF